MKLTVPTDVRGPLTVPAPDVAAELRVAEDPYPSPSELTPAGLRHRRWVRTVRALAPAFVVASTCFALGGFSGWAAAWGVLLALALLAPAALLRNFAYPHSLMPVSRFVVAVMPVIAGLIVVVLVAVLIDAPGPKAGTLVPAFALAAIAAILVEVAGRKLLEWRPLRVAVLGSPEFAAALRREIQAGSAEPVEVIGWFNPDEMESASSGPDDGIAMGSVRAAILELEVDLLVRGNNAAGQGVSDATYRAVAQGCLGLPVRIMESTQFYEQQFGHVPIGAIGSGWFLYLMHPRFESPSPRVKRLFDLVVAGMASVFALPLIAIAAIAIKLQDRGSVFYRQERVGEGGRTYQIVKLRTMAVDAEHESGAQWSEANDPRVTRVGRILRTTHIDELPQLINVLRGDMTLVGPRPERPEMIAELEGLIPHYQRRLLVKPGVTGWAQVRCGYAGTELGTAWKLSHDLFYLKHRSLLADVLIMLETLAVALRDSHRPLKAPQPEFLFGMEQ